MIKFKIKPYDVLFFGSGKPFNAGDTASSIFPPFPHTFASAICSKIYSEFKIDVSKILKEVYGPFLYNEEDKKIYFPKPADIYTGRKGKDNKIYVLKLPNKNYKLFNPENTNGPGVILPVYVGEEEVEPFDGFISQDGLQKWIDGKEPERNEIVKFKDIFDYENRIGIRQDIDSHTVKAQDGLYRIDFLRLKEKWGFVFWVEFNFNNDELKKAGLDDESKILNFFNKEPKSLKLGGEMKNASYEVSINDIRGTLKQPNLENNKIIKILFLTPATFDNVNGIFPQTISGMKIKSIISNGFVKLAINSKNLNLEKYIKNALKPGSVIYAEIDSSSNQNLWFSTFKRTNNFIGTNLIIYSKGG